MKTTFLFTLILSLPSLVFAYSSEQVIKKKLMTGEKGFLTCSGGGTSAPLFSAQCKRLDLSRINASGSIKYEGRCRDLNEKTFIFACESFTFEYERILPREESVIRK